MAKSVILSFGAIGALIGGVMAAVSGYTVIALAAVLVYLFCYAKLYDREVPDNA